MRQIPIGEHFALVDDADYERLKNMSWRVIRKPRRDVFAVYPCLIHSKKVIPMARIVTGDFESYCIDHKDRNPLNNQRENLRPATQHQNVCNRRDQQKPKGEHGFGIKLTKRVGFACSMNLCGHVIRLSGFPTAEEARKAYDALKYLTVGEFAPLHSPATVTESIESLKSYMARQRKEYIAKIASALGSKRDAARVLGISESNIYSS